MRNRFLFCLVGFSALLGSSLSAAAQTTRDPLTKFLDGVFKRGNAQQVQEPAPEPVAEPARREPPTVSQGVASQPTARTKVPASPPRPRNAPPASQPSSPPPPEAPLVKPVTAEPPKSLPHAEPTQPAKPSVQESPKASTASARPAASVPVAPAIPNSPTAALERVNAYFNGIDQMSAYFVQNTSNGQRAEGTLSVKRPGQLHFAYAPPSTLEVVSDGRSVAVRDKKLGTNDVYSVRQTPLKFLLQEQVDLAKDTKIRDVQVSPDGIVTVLFEDSATLGGTSKITLRFDARANALKQWTVLDAQGYETTVVLSGLNVVRRESPGTVN